jgi:hypothetical protein
MKFTYTNPNYEGKEFEIDLETLCACPGCGHVPDEYEVEDEFIYPINRERTLWTANCTADGCGCGWSVLATSPEEALNVWNRRVQMKRFSKHECRRSSTCCCSMSALEPDESCPIHGAGEWPPRCEICGKFMRRIQT